MHASAGETPDNPIVQEISSALSNPVAIVADNIHPSLRASFIALPSDPATRLTPDQLLAVFGGKDRIGAERDMLRRLREQRGTGDGG